MYLVLLYYVVLGLLRHNQLNPKQKHSSVTEIRGQYSKAEKIILGQEYFKTVYHIHTHVHIKVLFKIEGNFVTYSLQNDKHLLSSKLL